MPWGSTRERLETICQLEYRLKGMPSPVKPLSPIRLWPYSTVEQMVALDGGMLGRMLRLDRRYKY